MRYDLKRTHVAANVQRGFAGRLKVGGGLSWSVRRRIMQALRASVRVLGMRRKRRSLGPVHPGSDTGRSVVGAAMASVALALVSPALATVVTETTAVDVGTQGSTCSIASASPTVASTWTCEVPNGSGGFATISGVPSTPTGDPDLAWLNNWVSTNLPGANAIVLGTATTRASGANAIAIGNAASAVGPSATAVGAYASATGNEALAFGAEAEADGIHSVAIGSQAQALNTNAIAIGRESDALGEYAVGIGSGAEARGNLGTAVGNNALARQGDTALGAGALDGTISSGSTVAVGYGAGQGAGDVSRSTFVGAFAGAESQGTQNSFSGYFGGAAAIGNNNVAHGVAAGAAVTGDNNVSIGNQAGTQAQIDSNGNPVGTLGSAYNRAVNIGQDTRGLADDAVAIGTDAAAVERAVAIGTDASALGQDGVAVGASATSGATGYNVAIGAGGTSANANSTNEGAVAIGVSQFATGDGAVALGSYNTATGDGSVAIGRVSFATGDGSLALGDSVTASGNRAVALGTTSSAMADSGVALGNGAKADSGDSAVAIGRIANASGAFAIAMGDSARASAEDALAFGSNAQSSGIGSIAVGLGSQVSGDQSIAIGVGHDVSGDRSGAFGDPTTITGNDSYAIGNDNVIDADQAFVLGNNVTIAAGTDRAVSLGHNSNVTVADGVALGAGSIADTVVGTASATINGTTYNFAGAVPLSTVSVGSVGNERTITNLAAGRVSATSTDAINGSQLFATNQAVEASKTHYVSINDAGQILGSGNYNNDGATGLGAIAIGTNASAQGTLSVAFGFQSRSVGRESISVGWNATSAGNSEIHIGTESGLGGVSTNVTNIGIGIRTGQNVRGTANTAMGWQAGNQVTGDLNVALGRQSGMNVTGSFNTALGAYTGQNVTGASNIALGNLAGNGITASDTVSIGSNSVAGAQNGDVALGRGSVTAVVAGTASSVNNGITYNYAGIAPTSTVSIGNLGAERTITNVAAGRVSSTSTDAVNGSQLFATNTAVGNLAQSIAGGMSSSSYVNPDGSVTTALNVGGTTYNNVQDALTQLNATAGAGWNISAQGANATNVAAGSATGSTVDFKSSDGNVVVSKDTANNDIEFALADDITVDSVTAGNTTVDTSGVSIAGGPNGTVSLTGNGLDNGGNRITNVAAGTAATDAVNVGQLNAAVGSVNIGFAGNSGANITRSSGQVLVIQGGGTTTGSYSGGNIRTVTDPGSGAINIEMAEAPKFGTVTVNDGGTGKITGVTAATLSSTSTEAVNGSQLHATNQAVAAATQAANAGWNLTDANGNAANIGPDGNVVFEGDGNIRVTQTGADDDGKIEVALADDITVDSVTAGNTTLDTSGVSIAGGPSGTVSLTGSGLDNGGNRITNVAAGVIGAASTDAVNGSQLFALGNSTASSLGGGSSYNPSTGQVVASLSVGGTTYNNVQDALTQLNATAGAGWIISAQGANATNVAAGSATGSTVDFKSSDGNVVVSKGTASNDIEFALADDITVDSVTAGNTTVDTSGVSIAGGPNGTVSLTGNGLDNGGNRITNVAAGTAATDAVNVGQLNAAVGSVNIGFAGNSGANITRSSGQVLVIQGGGTTTGSYSGGNIRTVTDPGSGAINIEMAEAPKFGTVTVNDGGTGKITGVTAATLSSTSTEAVNGSQLVALGDSIAASLSPGSTYNPATNSITAQIVVGNNVYSNVQDALQAITVNGGGGGWTLASGVNGSGVVTGDASASIAPGATATFVAGNNMTINQSGGALELALNPNLTGIQSIAITGGPTINGNGIDMGGDRITNVGAGVAPTDAVNLGQMNAGLANTLGQANRYTDTAIADLRFDLTRYRRDANGGTAAAMAMSQVPQAFEPGMGIAGIGMSTWQGEQAIAFGISKASDNGRVVVRATGSYNSRSEGGAAVGVGFQF
ncbi:YadA-like family protein [Sphingopyxis sp. BSN-002]|uniref:YadA-like family protein n=1 Tax=Sphingopyxis sp. BSN-002 TaxID=2911495 RepID=UPI001EDA6F93|nr:YadA-like family protein [Sphingopyxis sp. BSN-002]UKK84096.1 YadA-like family protein [Sphingopyxis sp. BSN-002]